MHGSIGLAKRRFSQMKIPSKIVQSSTPNRSDPITNHFHSSIASSDEVSAKILYPCNIQYWTFLMHVRMGVEAKKNWSHIGIVCDACHKARWKKKQSADQTEFSFDLYPIALMYTESRRLPTDVSEFHSMDFSNWWCTLIFTYLTCFVRRKIVPHLFSSS